jgi:hypothetical protein
METGALGKSVRRWIGGLLALGIALGPVPATAELRIGDFSVFLNDFEVTVQLVLLDAVPQPFLESLRSGIPVQARLFVELWRFRRFWADTQLQARTLDRQLSFNVLVKEYKVVFAPAEQREPYLTKDLREAQRVLSDVRTLKLVPVSDLDARELFYVRARAEVSIGGPNTFFARLFGQAEETSWTLSPLLTITRRQ